MRPWVFSVSSLFGACVSDQDFYRQPEVYAPRQWGDLEKASTVGTAFALTFPDSANGNGRVLSVRAESDTTLTVTQRAVPGGWAIEHSESFAVAGGVPATIRLSRASWEDLTVPQWWNPSSPSSGLGAALRVDSETPIEVRLVYDPEPENAPTAYAGWGIAEDLGLSVVLPVEELGTRYQVVAPGPTDRPEASFYFFVVAVDDQTEVTARDQPPVVLDRGELTRVTLTPADITADRSWLVTASRPVAVFSGGGAACAGSTLSGRPSSSWEQIPPVTRWGTDYVALPILGVESSDLVVVADGETFVQLDCGEPIWLAPGQILRRALDAPMRVSGPAPFLVMVESRRAHCDVWEGGAGLTAVTPTALHRSSATLGLLDEEIELNDVIFEQMGAKLSDVAGVVAEPGPALADPSPVWVGEGTSGSSAVGYLEWHEPTTLTGERVRGYQSAISPYPDRTGPDAAEAYGCGCWEDVLYVTHLGYDCTDCVPDLTVPATCP